MKGLSGHESLSSYSLQIRSIILFNPTNTSPPRYVSLQADKMSSMPSAAVRVRTISTLIVSNEGAGSSQGGAKFQFQDTPEYSPRRSLSSPTDSNPSTAATSNSSVYSDRDDQSARLLHVPQEHASNTPARRANAGSTPHPSPTPGALQRNEPSTCVRAGLPKSKSEPTLMSSLRRSLSSFVSTLFTPRRKGQHASSHSETRQDDRKESERLRRWSARQGSLPLR